MDYKKILRNSKSRYAILRALSWIPDGLMVRVQYFIKTGRFPKVNSPHRYTEKLQWYKLYYHNPLMHVCVDKYEVRSYVKEKGLSEILNECYGVFNSVDEIRFDDLPNKFVVKNTVGGGGRSVIIVLDKAKINYDYVINQIKSWRTENVGIFGREWAYEGIKPRIIIERYINSDSQTGLVDYKFFCFGGKVRYIYVMTERDLGNNCRLSIYDSNYNFVKVHREDEKIGSGNNEKPENFEKMVQIAETLALDFPHVRVDLYNVEGKIIFGELTFYDGSGYQKYIPDSFDFTLGKYFPLVKYPK